MSIITRQNELFYNSLFELVVFIGFVIILSYALYRVHERQRKVHTHKLVYNSMELMKCRDYNRSLIRHRSILSHKDLLKNLEYATDNCYEKTYALQCIDIVVYCPHLLNMKSSLSGITPFHRVCFHGQKCLITFMLAKGADPFIATNAGENALCMAIYYFLKNQIENDFSCLEILYKTGCKFGLKNTWYNTMLELAFSKKNLKLVQWIILHGEIPSQNLLRCSSTPLK